MRCDVVEELEKMEKIQTFLLTKFFLRHAVFSPFTSPST